LFVWTRASGTRAVYSGETQVGGVSVSQDGARIRFATRGFLPVLWPWRGANFVGGPDDLGDLWEVSTHTGAVRLLAVVQLTPDSTPTKSAEYLRRQQIELIEAIRKRRRDREIEDSVRLVTEPSRPQIISVPRGVRVVDLGLSPDDRFLSFHRVTMPPDRRTSYMDFVSESGYATELKSRPMLLEPPPAFKLGLVEIDSPRNPGSTRIVWVDPGTTKSAIVHGPYWNAQGTRAVVQILSLDHKDRWISVLDPKTGRTSVVHHDHVDDWLGGPLAGGRWAPGYLQWLPDGTAFGFVSEKTGWTMLYLATLEGEVRQLTSGEWEVRNVQLSPDGKTWYLATSQENPAEEQFYHLPVRGGAPEPITVDHGTHRSVPSPDGGSIATLYETARYMPDLYVQANHAGTTRRRITKSGTDMFYRYAWAPSEIVTFLDPKGKTTWARIWAPPPSQNRAALIYAHGCGECSRAVADAWLEVPSVLYSNYLRQLGYVTAFLDYRGGLGHGHEYRTYAYGYMGGPDVDSGLGLLDLLVDRFGVDRHRIGLYGRSYGGFFTLMSLFRHPGTYAAGVALYPGADWAHYFDPWVPRILGGYPYDAAEAYRRSSPVYLVDGLRDPLQIQHGLIDSNNEIQDTYRLVQILLEHKKDFDFVTYPVEEHGWKEPASRRDSYERMTRWFDSYLVGKADNSKRPTR
jgi:dipeptidyl aminopeptidase/acylaminoacyl peptidase